MCLYLQSTISLLKGYYKPYKVTYYYSEDGRIVQPIKCICRTKQNTARFQCTEGWAIYWDCDLGKLSVLQQCHVNKKWAQLS